jgi:cytochrome c553
MKLIWAGLLFVCVNAKASDGVDFFEKNVRPVLVRQCLACHSSPTSPMGGLRLDTREGMLKGGARGPAVVPGKPADSLLLRAVRQSDSLKMPPSGKLKDADIAALAEWIEMGAPWGAPVATSNSAAPAKKYWAFVPPAEPKLPEVHNGAWAKSPIDRFVLAALEAKGLQPAAAADKRTLIRRATFDLTGLPPTPDEIRAFLEDSRADAFARVIDRLLASPHYGERWGRHWLDVARYADSNGLDENLVYRHAYRYRDYVIQAFNKDKPYDLFLKEQLAGDLLPGPTTDAVQFERWTATGFLSLGAKMLAEDDPVKMEMDIVDEQLDTTARTFMGLTVGCARCHDHKFDPIPQADYYSLAGIFKSSKTMENFNVVAQWNEYVLAPEAEREKLKEHKAKIEAKSKEMGRISGAENKKLITEAREHAGAYLLAAEDVLRYEGIHLRPAAAGGKVPAGAVRRTAGSFDRGNAPRTLEKEKSNAPKGAKGPFFAEYDVSVPAAGDYQVDFLEEEVGAGTADVRINGVLEHGGKRPVENREASPDAGGWSVTGVFALKAGSNTIRLEHKSRFPYFEALMVSAFPRGTTAPRSEVQVSRQYGVNPGFLSAWVEELRRSKGAPNSVLFALFAYSDKGSLAGDALAGWTSPAAERFRGFLPQTREQLAARYQELFSEADAEWQKVLKERGNAPKEKAERNAVKQEEGLSNAALEAFRELSYAKAGPFAAPGDARQYYPQTAQDQLAAIEKERKELEAATPDLPRAMGVQESAKIANLPIHLRGSHWTLGEEVPRRFPRAIAGDNQTPVPDGQSGRLQLAEWLTRADHPLTSRVMANRIWRGHFGRGIVPSMDNFGRLGEAPTNQPLLDWLALRFVEQGWSIKQMHRTIMLSSTYQMSSNYDAHAAEADPENTLLWRNSRRRLEAEAIRDAVTAVTGVIDMTPGGTMLSQKDREYVSNTSRRGGADYDLPRRAVYLPVVRSSMYEMFQAFDLPDPSTPNGDRNSTVVAPQALFLMNATLVLKSTHDMAAKLLEESGVDDAARVREVYERALGRPPAASDVDRALTFVAQVEKAMEGRETDAGKRHLFAWQSFCKAMLSSNEFIYVN